MESKVVRVVSSLSGGVDKLIALEKREYPRVDIKLDLSINFSNSIKAKTINVSESGICFFADDDLGESKFMTLIIYLAQNESVKAIGKVVWVLQLQPLLYQYGLKFWDIDPERLAYLREFIEQHR
jgi:c-di-GMP-binding flagellar brake protein YcgR